MKYHTLFFSQIRKDVAKFVSAAVLIGTLRVEIIELFLTLKSHMFISCLIFLSLNKMVTSFDCT